MVPIHALSRYSDSRCQTVSVDEAAARLGIGRDTAYAMIRVGNFPVPVLRLGPKQQRILVPVGPLNRLLGNDEED